MEGRRGISGSDFKVLNLLIYCRQYSFLNLAPQSLREAVSCRVVVAGGVNTLEQIVELEKLGCDVQLGMALYTGKVNFKDAFIGCLNFEKVDGMIPVIAQSSSGEVLMMGYSNKEAFEKSFATGKLTFFFKRRSYLGSCRPALLRERSHVQRGRKLAGCL